MEIVEANMAEKSLPPVETAEKVISEARSENLNFKCQDLYSSQETSSVSPTGLSEESDEGLMTLGIRNGEALVKSRSSSSSSSVDENLLASNIGDRNKIVVQSNDVLINYDVMAKFPYSSSQKQTFPCGKCGLTLKSLKDYLHHHKNEHNQKISIYECASCNFASSSQEKLVHHLQLAHCSNEAADSHGSSHNSTEEASSEERDIHTSALLYRNSSQRNSTHIKEEAKEMEDDDQATLSIHDASTSQANTDMASGVFDKTKKRRARQEVDPCKYFEVIDATGSKFACSECGNIYKWRKSLNKHWKEKHFFDQPDLDNPHGLMELFKAGKYTHREGRAVYNDDFLRSVKIKRSADAFFASPSTILSHSSHFSDKPNKSTSLAEVLSSAPYKPHFNRKLDPLTAALLPHPVNSMAFSQLRGHNNSHPLDENILDLSCDLSRSSGKHHQDIMLSSDQEKPLNLSKNTSSSENVAPEVLMNKVVAASRRRTRSGEYLPDSSQPDSSCQSETHSANLSFSQMQKKVTSCFECKIPINSMNCLNDHFIQNHFQSLLKHKEAIKKIPHGLQQCYHLLDMEISDIANLGSQDLAALDEMVFKCKSCDFEAQGAAELQKHSTVHTVDRPYVCMVCGTTYKLKWDLVKHFEKSHELRGLPNPYRRNDHKKDAVNGSYEEADEPVAKKAKSTENKSKLDSGLYGEGIVDAVHRRKSTNSLKQNGLDLLATKAQTIPSVYKNIISIDESYIEEIASVDRTTSKNDRSSKTRTVRTLPPYMPHPGQESDIYKLNITMEKDTKTYGSKQGKFQCPDCEFKFQFLSELTQHMKIHTEGKPYKCPHCEYRSKWKWDIPKHVPRCQAARDSGVDKPRFVKRLKGKVARKSPQATSKSSPQSVNRNVASSSSHTNNLDDFPEADPGTLPRKVNDIGSIFNHPASLNNIHAAHTSGLLAVSLKQATETTSDGDVSSSSSSPIASTTPSQTHKRSAQIWRCSHCPFTTHVQARLKRHSCGHSESKPFKCDQCSYSTNWPSDLKKHRMRYKHFIKSNESQVIEKTHEEFQQRFRCFHCSIYFGTLQELTDHHLTNHTAKEPNQTPGASVNEIDFNEARIKHPRKRSHTLYIQCPDCPSKFTCPMMFGIHLSQDIHCNFCKSLFANKESFFDHVTSHEEFVPKEWELYFMICENEQAKHLQRVNYKPLEKHADAREITQNYSRLKDSNEKGTVHPSLSGAQPVVAKKTGQVLASQESLQLKKHACGWCLEEFISLTAVIDHARLYHPGQLNDQTTKLAIIEAFSHVAQNHNAITKYRCTMCHFSHDDDEVMFDHYEKNHHQLERGVEVMDFKQTDNSESQKQPETPPDDVDKTTEPNPCDKPVSPKMFSCPLCPFKTATEKRMKGHIYDHVIPSEHKCHVCDYSSPSIAGLLAHIKVHEKGNDKDGTASSEG